MNKNISRMNPPRMIDASELGYSQISIVEPGRMAYVSSQSGGTLDGSDCPDDIVAQAANMMEKLSVALDALAASPMDIVMLRVYVLDIAAENLAEFWPVVLEFLDGCEPSVSLYSVKEMIMPEIKISLDAVIRLPDAPSVTG